MRPKKKSVRRSEPPPVVEESGSCAIPPLVVLGASAGGLEVFQQFFAHIPAESGLAFVLIQHLDPNHETLVPELLAKHMTMPAQRVVEPVALKANHVYVIPANALLTLEKGILRSAPPATASSQQMPIDHFLRSAAADMAEHLIAVILSGNGTDGTAGLKGVKEHGGMTLAQSLNTAKFDSMPRSAISTGLVDYVLPVEEMPQRIRDYVAHLRALQRKKGIAGLQEEIGRALSKIVPVLRRETGHDFSRYKQSRLVRRIQRRMQLLYFDNAGKYIECLQRDPQEVENLFKDLLIGVTQFFRDPEAFDALARDVIPAIFRDKRSDSHVRVWVTGCATGEEAYSIAMLMAEHMGQLEAVPSVQIFATDLDDEALEIARKGIYPEHTADQLSMERLKRFFVSKGEKFEVIQEIRDMCVFSLHNLIKDPPFSRQDLISCRNLLIYLEADLQRKLLPVFHYALNPSGFLFLGPSENLASRSELFRTIDKKHRVFQRKPSVLRQPLQVPMMEPGRVTRLPPTPTTISPATGAKEQNVIRTIERVLIEEYAPASVIINEQGEIVYFSGRTGQYLEPAAGVPSNKIITMVRRHLRLELRTAVQRAIASRQEVVRENIVVKVGAEVRAINLVVRPLPELGQEAGLFIVLFQELVPAPKTSVVVVERQELDSANPIIQQLENELRTTKEDLQTTIEELETSNEELKSANEELLSMNEELQSTNEELQTSKEELQSLNDELQRKLEELDAANADLQNVFQSTQVATVFLDSQLRIKRFTPAINQLVPLAERDIGRHLLDVAPDLAQPEIVADLEAVLRTLTSRERQLPLRGGQSWYMVRSMPYRALDQTVQGAVMTFSDVTELKFANTQRAEVAAIVESSHDGIIGKSLDGIITSWNRAAERMYGYKSAEAVGSPISIIVPPEKEHELPLLFERMKRGERVETIETERIDREGRRVMISLTLSPIVDSRGRIVGFSGIDRDISEQKRANQILAEAQQRVSRHAEELEALVAERTQVLNETVKSLEGVCYTIAHDLRAPLRTLQGFSRILLEDYASGLDEEGRSYAERICVAAARMDTLIRDLLDYARLTHLELPLAALNLSDEVQKVLAQMAPEIEGRKANVTVKSLPRVFANDVLLAQVITNLVSNALKFVPQDVVPEVEIWAERNEKRVRMFVKDNGIGIDPAQHERIFGLFQRLHRLDVYPGTGLGLAIVRKGMERMGGAVGLQSLPGQGSCFYIDLRLASEQP